jgi:hypothetical protein
MGGLRSPVQNEVADFIGVISDGDGEFVSLHAIEYLSRQRPMDGKSDTRASRSGLFPDLTASYLGSTKHQT